MQGELIIQLLARGAITGSVYALLGVSWGVIYNTTKTFHFAHGFVYTFAAYVTILGAKLGLPVLLSIPLGLIGAAAMGCAIERWAYQPMRDKNASQLTVFLTAMGIMIAGHSLIHLLFGPDSNPLHALTELTYTWGPITFTNIDSLSVVLSWAAIVGLWFFLRRSKVGVMIRAVSSNPEKALFIGIDSRKIFILVFGVGSALVGLASLLSLLEHPANPQIGLHAILISFVSVFLGGVGNLAGAALGGFILGLLQSIVLLVLPTEYKLVVTYALLFLVIIMKPEGLLGEKTS